MATVIEERGSVAGRGVRVGWAVGSLAVLALAGVVVAAVAVLSGAPTIRQADERPVVPLYTADEIAVMRLVAKGYIPAETLDAEPFRMRGLVNQGLVPRAALEPRSVVIAPLYSAQERAVMAAVTAGVIPQEALDGEPFLTKRLINQGLVPRQAANP
jgi:hypothetical protein